MDIFLYFSRPPLPQKKRGGVKNEEISTNRKRRLSFCDAAKKAKVHRRF